MQIPKAYRQIYEKAMAGKSRKASINAFCLMCCSWQPDEVRNCTDERLYTSSGLIVKKIMSAVVKTIASQGWQGLKYDHAHSIGKLATRSDAKMTCPPTPFEIMSAAGGESWQ